jgi:hypothetical protein
MNTMRKRITVPLAIVLALAITPALSGCFGNPLEQIIEGATGGDVDLGGKAIPDGFPTNEVPLIAGEIQFGGSIGTADAKVYNVTFKVTGASPVDAIKAQLEGAGFTTETEFSGDGAEGGTLIYTSPAWGVLVVVGKDSNAWIVNYTVSSADQQ